MKLLYEKVKMASPHWKESCVGTECTLHQLSPYIGKLKSSIAGDLVATYSEQGDLIADPFSGSGTIPLEAILQGRKAFAADISPYAKVLCQAKLKAPSSVKDALKQAEDALNLSSALPDPDLRRVLLWVRQFFHPRTLKEAIKFATICKRDKHHFLFACFLGILHHQRPGFLSYPSSHLVPYLREKKYPHDQFPELYQFRELRPRLISKIRRAYKRGPAIPINGNSTYKHCSIKRLNMPESFDCLITSPPYMNALDYNRDNRLRLWFINPEYSISDEDEIIRKQKSFKGAMAFLAKKVNASLKSKGYCVIIVGERIANRPHTHLSNFVCKTISDYAPLLKLQMIMEDDIPDIRRSRRDYKGTKTEHFLIFQKA
jgi:hypothetical protein